MNLDNKKRSSEFDCEFDSARRAHFFLDLGDADWNTLLAAIKFSMYCPSTWFSDFSFRFSTFTESTRDDKSSKETDKFTHEALGGIHQHLIRAKHTQVFIACLLIWPYLKK